MQNPQKKPYKGFYSKFKPQNNDHYDYESFEPGSQHNHYYKPGNMYKYSRSKKYYPEYTYQPIKNSGHQPNKHDDEFLVKNQYQANDNQYENPVDVPYSQPNGTDTILPKEGSKPRGKEDKKPEKQLYSARKKYSKNAEGGKTENNSVKTSTEGIGFNDKAEKKKGALESDKKDHNHQTSGSKGFSKREDKERLSSDEDKSFVSNVSTAISDKVKTCEDEGSTKEKGSVFEAKKKAKKSQGKILMQILLQSENCMEKLRIYEDEEDYEGMLDKVCRDHNFKGSAGLYFKINMLKMIYDMHYNKSRVEPALKKNLALNAKLILCENGLQEIDESIRPFLSCNNNLFC